MDIANKPQPILLESQAQLFELEAAMEEHIYLLEKRIRDLVAGRVECDTIESLSGRRDAAKAAYEIVRRAF